MVEHRPRAVAGRARRHRRERARRRSRIRRTGAGVAVLAIFGDDRWVEGYEPAVRRSRTKLVFEGPGKDPFLVLDAQAPREVAAAAVRSGCFNAGQACTAPERLHVVPEAYDEFVAELVAATSRLRSGDPWDEETDVGPLAEAGAARVASQLEQAVAAGARLLAGGGSRRLGGAGRPVLVEPTVIVDVDHTMALLGEETLGPVLPVVLVTSVEEAVRLAEDSRYGLSATVFGGPQWVRERLSGSHGVVHDGETWLDRRRRLPVAPYGGRRRSGWVWEWCGDQFLRRDGPRLAVREFSRAAED